MTQVVNLAQQYHLLPWEEVLRQLKTDPELGLTTQQYQANLAAHGDNMIHLQQGTPWYWRLFGQFTNPFILLLQLAGAICFLGYGLDQSSNDYLYLGIVLFLVVIATALFSFYQEMSSSRIMDSFKNLIPSAAKVYRDGQLTNVDVDHLTLGDLVEFSAGDKVPADIRLLTENGLKVDNSMLTGENEPQDRTPEESSETVLESRNMIFYGTLVVEGSGKGIVVQAGDSTEMGKIAKFATSTKAEKTPIAKEISRFVKIISAIAIVLAVIFTVLGFVKGNHYIANIIFGLGILVANVPEGLLATVTIVLTLAAKRMAKKKVLVKNLEAVETLGSTSNICSDKTGTLTYNRMTVSHLWLDGQIKPVKLGLDNSVTLGGEHPPPNPLTPSSFKDLYFLAKTCNTAVFSVATSTNPDHDQDPAVGRPVLEWETIGNLSDGAILKFTTLLENTGTVPHEWHAQVGQLHTVGDIPFNSRNKWHLIINQENRSGTDTRSQFVYSLKGAPERVRDRCTHYLKNGERHQIDAEFRRQFQEAYEYLAGRGERVLGFGIKWEPCQHGADFPHDLTNVDGSSELLQCFTFVGFIGFVDPPRETVRDSISQCHTAGIRVVMVTGDHPLTAQSIATQVGILGNDRSQNYTTNRIAILDQDSYPHLRSNLSGFSGVVVHGDVVDRLELEEWDQILEKDQTVFARTSPEQKLVIVNQYQRKGHIVAVTGDGVNDSPALKTADIGVAMGITGSDISKEAADMILLDDNFSSIVNGVVEGRTVFDNLKKSIAYTLSSNIPEIMPFLAFMVFDIPLPLTTVLILLIDLGTDMVPAISLAYEAPEDDIMERKPRDPKKDRLVTWRLISFSYLQIGMIQALAGFFTYLFVLADYGFPYHILGGLGLDWGKEDLYCHVPGQDYPSTTPTLVNQTTSYSVTPTTPVKPLMKLDPLVLQTRGLWDGSGGGAPHFYDIGDCSFTPAYDRSLWATADYSLEALQAAQTAYFISIIIVQIADLLICKTRKLSLFSQPFNRVSLLGFVSELALGALICYVPYINIAVGTRPIKWYYWACGVPFAIIIVVYDEIRKLLIRTYPGGLVERLTYW